MTAAWFLAALSLAHPVLAQNAFIQHNLVSDIPGMADITDTNLVNPWGIAFTSSSPFWISDNHSGLSTLYTGAGAPQSLIVNIPPHAGGTPPAAPTGIIANTTSGFNVTAGAPAHFIFSTEDGTIVGWASGTNAVLKVDNSASGTVYKGLAIGTNGNGAYLFAADFHGAKVDVFDSNFTPATLSGTFSDPTIPAGFAPFGIQNINGQIYVTYARQDPFKHDDVPGPGNGYVDIYDTNGNLLSRLASNGVLNSPWGIALAPTPFGPFSGAILIGNFGDGRINAFNPTNSAYLGAVRNAAGDPLAIQGLWGIAVGNGGRGGDAHTLYFTAGIAGESHGLLGSLSPFYPAATSLGAYLKHNLVSDLAGMADFTDTNLVNPWGIAFSSASPFWISDNHSGLSTLYTTAGTPQSLVVNTPPPAGGPPPAAPTGIIANSTTGFAVTPGAPAHFIFSTEDGTIIGWASGTNAVLKVDNSATGTVYKGLAFGTNANGAYLFATDFHGGKVDIFDSNYAPATLAGSFADPAIPAGYAPFGIQNISGQIFVSYARQDPFKHDDVGGPGIGYVNIFDTTGTLIRRFTSNGPLNSPWGMALAPVSFGTYGGALLIANFGDGHVNAFNPFTGAFLGSLADVSGVPFAIEGLWGIAFGNGGRGGDSHTLYFTAGLNGESDGLFGSISPVIPTFFTVANQGATATVNWSGGVGPFLLQQKLSLADSNWFDVMTTTNQSAIVAAESSSAFFRLLNQATNNVLPFTVLLTGAGQVPEVNTTALGLGVLSIEGTNLNYSINFSGLSGAPSAVNFQGPADPNSIGGILFALNGTAGASGAVSGTQPMTPAQLTNLINGAAYLNITTALNPGGEIRGQIVPLQLNIVLNGGSEVPAINTTATAAATLTFVGNQMFYTITYSGLKGPASAINLQGPAPATAPGALLATLNTPSGTSGTVSGSLILAPSQLAYLLANTAYLNIQTTANPGGEIRGQIIAH